MIQLDLNLQISKQQLKAQSSTPPKFRDQRIGNIRKGLEEIKLKVRSCTTLLEESLGVLTTLLENPAI